MGKINILDCTLRDGGRIIDCNFPDETIQKISEKLNKSKIDIIEVGFIRNNIIYNGNSTFFEKVEDINQFIYKGNGCSDSKYVVFVDFGMYDLDNMSEKKFNNIDGIRFGFTKKDFYTEREEIEKQISILWEKGYDIYLQDVNTLGYSDLELLELIDFTNKIRPISFGIVDTYGSMDLDELNRVFSIVNHNLNREIAIDFHSHNNMQLSFALAQEMIRLCRDSRDLIIDATLNGMGKCAGNLNTELIISYMNRKLNSNYDLDMILDIIDEYLYDIKQEHFWGYSIPSFMAGVYKAHPNNVIYLTEKFRLLTKDIKHIISRIDEETRQKYDYDNIQKIYKEYTAQKIDDSENKYLLKEEIGTKPVLILVPGKSLIDYKTKIHELIAEEQAVVISVNFVPDEFKIDYAFYGNSRRYENSLNNHNKKIITSNIEKKGNDEIVFNYYSLVEGQGEYFDNSTIMLLNLLKILEVKQILIAGFDGFTAKGNDFVDKSFHQNRFKEEYEKLNKGMGEMMRRLASHISGKTTISFITPSKYKDYF